MIGWLKNPAPVTAAELARIQRRGHLRVAVKDNLKPLGFRTETGQLQGFEIDLAQRLAQDLWGEAEAALLVPVSNAERLPAVVSGTVDLAIANLSDSDNRRRVVQFSQPYYVSGTGILTTHPGIRRPRDLTHRSVAVLQGSRAIAIVQSALPGVHLVGVNSYQGAQQALDRQEVDAFVGDAVVLQGWAQPGSQYRYLPQGLATHRLAIALPKGTQFASVRQWVDQRLQSLQQEGWLEERQQYWGLNNVQR
ncbi:transporter substrate-binding domain-containing protein [Synechococcales cyanobacterium C]|uniref:Transporter substrate-binding domain-containing protein n=2 Tax=Petrachloros TaxID=2918834 RepID=A0A8K2A818_9CYAN|nr:transporter substrate-binding domain-containing protein [Petrachloros mirabilis ULC683]